MSDVRDLPSGAPESRLSAQDAALLPTTTPAPPWRCRVEALVWWQRPAAATTVAVCGALPPVLAARVRAPVVVGAVVRYLSSPVGPYEEVLSGVLVRGVPRAPLLLHLPFLAVDSAASVSGGRAHWALPKTLATVRRPAPGLVVAQGPAWRISAQAAPRGPRLPVAGVLPGLQLDADGAQVPLRAAAYGTGRAACVQVQVGTDLAGEPGSLAGWLRSGTHPGAVLALSLRVGGGRRAPLGRG